MPVTISKNWNVALNYWEMNPVMMTLGVFKNLYIADASKNKSTSSKLMWAIAMCCDPNESNPWRNTNPTEKQQIISEDFLNDPKFDWQDSIIIELLDAYQRQCLTIAEQQLIDLELKITQRGKFIKETDYSLDYYDEGKIVKGTADQLDKMMVNTIKIYEQYDKIKAMLSTEHIEGTGRGGAKESASEKKVI